MLSVCSVPALAQAGADAASRGTARAALLAELLGGRTVTLEGAAPSDQPSATHLRLEDSVALALSNNFEVKAAQAKVDAADWDTIGAYAGFLPTVQYTHSKGRERSQPAGYNDPVTDARVLDDKHARKDRVLSLTQPLFDPTLIAELLLRQEGQSAAEMEQLGARESIALQTISSYHKLLQSQLIIRFAAEYKARLDQLHQLMKTRVEGGGAAPADLDRIVARAAAAESTMIEARSTHDANLDEFRRLTGVSPMTIEIPVRLLPAAPANLTEALTEALRHNPEYLLSQRQIAVQEMESNKAYSRLLPKLRLELSDSSTYNAGGASKGADIDGGPYPLNKERRAMLVASWAISGGTEVAQGNAAAAKAREAGYRSQDARTKIEESVRISFNALTAAATRVGVLQQSLESNLKVAEAFEQQYQTGNRPLLDLLDAFERLFASRVDLTRLLIAEALAGYQLRRQMGELRSAVLSEGAP